MAKLDLDTNLAEVQEALHGTETKWKLIGIQLKIPMSKMKKIESEYQGLEERNLQMQIAWLQTGTATWEKLVTALKRNAVGLSDKGDSIEAIYIRGLQVDNESESSEELSDHLENGSGEERLSEILEWLLKMGFTLDDMQKWITNKRKALPHRSSTSGEQLAASKPILSSTNHSSSGKERLSKTQLHPKKRNRSTHDHRKQPRPKRARSEEYETNPREVSPLRKRMSVDGGTKRLKGLEMLGNMMKILEILEKEESAEEFKRPVDKEEAADYYKVIEKPMWLDRMKRKVKDCCYRTPEMFCKDFNLIIENCKEYNHSEDSKCYVQQANQLEKKFHELMGTYLPEDDDYSEYLPNTQLSSSDSQGSVERSSNETEPEDSEGDDNSETCEENDQSLDTTFDDNGSADDDYDYELSGHDQEH